MQNIKNTNCPSLTSRPPLFIFQKVYKYGSFFSEVKQYSLFKLLPDTFVLLKYHINYYKYPQSFFFFQTIKQSSLILKTFIEHMTYIEMLTQLATGISVRGIVTH